MPIGATSTRPAAARPYFVSRPCFGRWKVTVTLASTFGLGWRARRQVERSRSVDGQHRHACAAGTDANVDCLADRIAESPGNARAEQAVDHQGGTFDAVQEEQHLAAGRGVDSLDQREIGQGIPVGGSIGRARRLIRRNKDDHRLHAPPARWRAATNASPPLLPGPAKISTRPEDVTLDRVQRGACGHCRPRSQPAPSGPCSARPMRWARRSAPRICSAVIGQRAAYAAQCVARRVKVKRGIGERRVVGR